MQNNNSNQPVQYSKINTILLVLLLVLAIGVFYVTYKQNHADDVNTASMEEVSDYNASEITVEGDAGANL